MLDFIHFQITKWSITVLFGVHRNKSKFSCYNIIDIFWEHQSWIFWVFSYTTWQKHPFELEFNCVESSILILFFLVSSDHIKLNALKFLKCPKMPKFHHILFDNYQKWWFLYSIYCTEIPIFMMEFFKSTVNCYFRWCFISKN